MAHAVSFLGMAVMLLLPDPPRPAGTTYRFRSDTGSGTVWMAGEDGRVENETGDATARGHDVMIWKNGGTQLFVINTQERTYYDAVRRRKGRIWPSVATLTVSDPLVVSGVTNIRVDVQPSPAPPSPHGATPDCRPVAVNLSYDLQLSHKMVPVTIPGRVKGVAQYCLSDSMPVGKLPFGHGVEIISGIPEVDALLAERLGSLKGVPLRSTLTVTRQLEGGEEGSATKTLELSDFRGEEVSRDRFAVPEGFQYKEPVIQPPVRQNP